MAIGMSTGLAILAFVIIVGPLIFSHELGHFIAARLFGITVEEFGIGFPPRMLTLFERNGTKYTLNWLPLGGFMRPAGENDPNIEGGLAAASRIARFCVLAAGPATNIVIAFLLLVLMFMIGAPELQPGVLVVEVSPDSPAAMGHMEAGDIIMAINDVEIDGAKGPTDLIYENLGTPITITVKRNEALVDLTVTPRTEWPEGQGPTGFAYSTIYELTKHGLFSAVGRALTEIGSYIKTFIQLPAMIIEQQIPARYLRPVSVVGISQLGGQEIEASIASSEAWPILNFGALISLALGITNLLPIPALDGGRILFVIVEAIRGKRINHERESLVHFVGFALLIGAMLVFVYLDIVDPLFQ
jgi:regulator of sigma E protease